jgi:branched-chain amino acid aminotransferase
VAPVSIWLSTDYARAAKGGTGAAKCGGNYAASLLPQQEAAAQGCSQVLFLDPVEGKYLEELGGMNVFFVFKDGRWSPRRCPAASSKASPARSCSWPATAA